MANSTDGIGRTQIPWISADSWIAGLLPAANEPEPRGAIDGLDDEADAPPLELGGVDGGAGGAAPTAGAETFTAAALAARPPAAVSNFVALATGDDAGPEAIGAAFASLPRADQRRAVEQLMVDDPAAAARTAQSLSVSDAGPDAFWDAYDASAQPGGRLFLHPDKALAFMRAADAATGQGADELEVQTLEHAYVGFLASPAYASYGRADASAAAAALFVDAVGDRPIDVRLPALYGELSADAQETVASAMASSYPVDAAAFAAELSGDTRTRFTDAASAASSQFVDELALRTGDTSARMQAQAKYYPDALLADISPLAKTDFDAYVDGLNQLAHWQPERAVDVLLAARKTNPALYDALVAHLHTSRDDLFHAVAHSDLAGTAEIKNDLAKDLLGTDPVAVFDLFKADANVASYIVNRHRQRFENMLVGVARHKPHLIKTMMPGVADSYAKEYARLQASADPNADQSAQILAGSMGAIIGVTHRAATIAAEDSDGNARAFLADAVEGSLDFAGAFYKPAAVAGALFGAFRTMAERYADGVRAEEISAREEQFKDVFMLAAGLAYEHHVGPSSAPEFLSFRNPVADGYRRAFGGDDAVLSEEFAR